MASLTRQCHRRLSQEQRRVFRHEQARKAREARRDLYRNHRHLPKQARAFFDPLVPAFTRPTYHRFALLAVAAIMTLGIHTICNLLRCLGALAPGHPSSYHRVFSRRRWRRWELARSYTQVVLERFSPQGDINLAGDDTVAEHPGPKVYGKACHRDPVRSTHSFTAFRWGHKWVILTLLVRLPFARRRWALPLLMALYQPEKENSRHGRRHKTPPQLLRQLLLVLLRWYPERKFVCTADGNYATHELAEFATQHRRQLTFVSKFYPNANLVAPPPPYSKKGRPRVKGEDLPAPAQVVAKTLKPQRLEVAWYGGGRRRVDVVTGTAHWYKGGRPLVPVGWVFVRDRTGTHRDEYFFTTETSMTPQVVIETYTGRWSIETTFQEVRSYLRLETTRGWSRNTVLRVGPCLFALYTVVAYLYAELPTRYTRVRVVDWPGKHDVTFSDAITAVRRWFWLEWIFATPSHRVAFSKLPSPFRQILLNGLAPAA
jgi:DDE superfamily endonuclease